MWALRLGGLARASRPTGSGHLERPFRVSGEERSPGGQNAGLRASGSDQVLLWKGNREVRQAAKPQRTEAERHKQPSRERRSWFDLLGVFGPAPLFRIESISLRKPCSVVVPLTRRLRRHPLPEGEGDMGRLNPARASRRAPRQRRREAWPWPGPPTDESAPWSRPSRRRPL